MFFCTTFNPVPLTEAIFPPFLSIPTFEAPLPQLLFASLHSRTSYNSPKLMASYLVLLTIKLRVPLFLGILNFLECPRLPSTSLGRNHKLVAGGVPTFLPSCHFIIVGSGERKPAVRKIRNERK
ncbi:hypothetical protein I7I48_06972 [Histoplasma ohiense]|nr:hypothetical protein I7I48_06972 [Histoplasma ohiense (nom. inval.)]